MKQALHSKLIAAAIPLALSLIIPNIARAQGTPKVRPPNGAQVAAAKAVLSRGLVYLIEQTPSGGLAQVTVFGKVNAPIETAFDVLSTPASLSKMQPAMDDIDVRAERGNAVTYRWHYNGTLVDTNGITAMALVRPQAVQWGLSKGFGPGNMLWRLYPEGDGTLVALCINVNIREANHTLIRWIAGNSDDAPPLWNLGHGILALRGLQNAAAHQAGRKAPPTPSGKAGSGPLRPLTAAQLKALAPLYARGSAGIIEQDQRGYISQATVVETVKAPAAKVREILVNPSRWGASFPDAVSVEMPAGNPSSKRFTVEISVPGVTVDAQAEIAEVPDGIDVTVPDGNLRGSIAAFRVLPAGNGSILTGAARFRPRQASRIIRSMVDGDPYFGHGLNASMLGLFSRGFQQGAER